MGSIDRPLLGRQCLLESFRDFSNSSSNVFASLASFDSGATSTTWRNLSTASVVSPRLYPALNASNEGYQLQVIADASGSGTKMGDDIALARMQQSGIGVASTIQILSELVFNWAEGAGPRVLPILGEIYAELG